MEFPRAGEGEGGGFADVAGEGGLFGGVDVKGAAGMEGVFVEDAEVGPVWFGGGRIGLVFSEAVDIVRAIGDHYLLKGSWHGEYFN